MTRAGGQAWPPRPPRPEGCLRLTFLFLGAGSPNRKWAASEGSGGDGVDGEDWSLARSQPQSPLLLLLQLPSGRARVSFQGSRPGSVGTRRHLCQGSWRAQAAQQKLPPQAPARWACLQVSVGGAAFWRKQRPGATGPHCLRSGLPNTGNDTQGHPVGGTPGQPGASGGAQARRPWALRRWPRRGTGALVSVSGLTRYSGGGVPGKGLPLAPRGGQVHGERATGPALCTQARCVSHLGCGLRLGLGPPAGGDWLTDS